MRRLPGDATYRPNQYRVCPSSGFKQHNKEYHSDTTSDKTKNALNLTRIPTLCRATSKIQVDTIASYSFLDSRYYVARVHGRYHRIIFISRGAIQHTVKWISSTISREAPRYCTPPRRRGRCCPPSLLLLVASDRRPSFAPASSSV